jgi:hypothetical protein
MVAYSFQRRFVASIRVGLGLSQHVHTLEPLPRPKRQTIRAVGKKRHARPGENVQLYHGLRTKAAFQIGTGICTRVRPIIIRIGELAQHKIVVEGDPVGDLDGFAQSDGFKGWEDMREFWADTHPDGFGLGGFQGLLIEWEPLS